VTLRDGASFDVRRGSRGGSGNSCLKIFTIVRRVAKSNGAAAKCSRVMGERTTRSGQESYEKYSGHCPGTFLTTRAIDRDRTLKNQEFKFAVLKRMGIGASQVFGLPDGALCPKCHRPFNEEHFRR